MRTHTLKMATNTKLSKTTKVSISLAEFKRLKEIETLYNQIQERGEPMICGNGSTKGCGEICYKSDQPKDWDGWRAFCKDCYGEEEEEKMVHCIGCNEPLCKFTEEPPYKDDRDEALCEECYDPCKTCIVCVDKYDYNNTGKMCLIHDPRDKCLGFRPQTRIGECAGCEMVCEECENLMIVEEKEEEIKYCWWNGFILTNMDAPPSGIENVDYVIDDIKEKGWAGEGSIKQITYKKIEKEK